MKHEFQADYLDIRLVPLTKKDSEKYRLLRNQMGIRNCFVNKRVISASEQEVWYEKYKNDPSDIMFSIYRLGGILQTSNNSITDKSTHGDVIVGGGGYF